MGRISREVMFMQMARVASLRSTCHRLNVGAIVTHNNSPVSVGWNGQRPGAPHCAGNDCPGIVPGNCGTLHAEANALDKACRILREFQEIDLYVTNSPCPGCVKAITQCELPVKRIFFEIPYRTSHHMGIFHEEYLSTMFMRRTAVYEVTPAGYVVEYFSREVIELP